MHLWYTNLILVTLGQFGDLIIGFLMANLPYIPDSRALAPPCSLEDAPVIHQLDPGDLGEVGRPHHWLSHDQFALHT